MFLMILPEIDLNKNTSEESYCALKNHESIEHGSTMENKLIKMEFKSAGCAKT